MAKRRAGTSEGAGGTAGGPERSAEATALEFAEDLGRLLGTAERKANDWLQQRSEVTKQLTVLRDRATALLQRLGSEAPFAAGRRGRTSGRPPKAAGAAGAGGARKRKGMSAAARKAVSERMRRYWAQRRKAEAK